ncbi:Oligopeptide transporter, OPT family [Propionibacterium freudenreichii]|nr:Oligopeptide transporter, OPT family [Propionibacterium freudenreichii]SCQ66930.1 Oligopeptide transporter, OPT family [Propionibacterium freudenreichii]
MAGNTTTHASGGIRELTVRAVVLGGIITLIFTAANVYLGLKVGLTFATSIPAAVISMAILRRFQNHTVVENNIVQTIASAAGTLSAIIFVLPGLVMIGWWTGFPYWTTAAVCAIGGTLGVMYSIPLRRALVTGSDLPYPEGVAGAEVLKVGDSSQSAASQRSGLRAIFTGAIGAGGFSLLGALKVVATKVSTVLHIGSGGTILGTSLSLALLGVGHLVGITVGIAMLVGVAISYGVLLPMLSRGAPAPLAASVPDIFATDVRFIGAGTIAVAAVWTLLKIIAPITSGIREAIRSTRRRHSGEKVDITEHDIPINIVAIVVVASMVPIGMLLWGFTRGTVLDGSEGSLIAVSLVFVLLVGLIVASVCGYMAGLIGASNSPISGVGILVAIAAAVLLSATYGQHDGTHGTALVAYTLFTAAVVFSVGTIANDNLQDLKTGQLVGATPWKQQVALIIGVVFGSLVIPPVLELMQSAFGFLGTPGAGDNALAAPQAALISSLVQGVFGDSLNWGLIGMGALIGVGVIIVDEILGRTTHKLHLPPLAVGMGMYLPITLTVMIPVGAIIGRFFDRWAERRGAHAAHIKRSGILLATGLIVGESLFGVVFAAIVGATGKDEPLAIVGDGFATWATALGIIVFVAFSAYSYWSTAHHAARDAADTDAVTTS